MNVSSKIEAGNGNSNKNGCIIQRMLKGRAPESTTRTVLETATTDIGKHIKNIVDLLDKGSWKRAYDLLTDEAKAKLLGATLDAKTVPRKLDENDDLEEASKKAVKEVKSIFLPEWRTIRLRPVQFSVGGMGPFGIGGKVVEPWDEPHARFMLAVLLEEWIHYYQHCRKASSGSPYLSERTLAFRESGQTETSGVDFDEVDIYSTYEDLGWTHILETWRSQYDERQEFAQWSTNRTQRTTSRWRCCFLTTACTEARGLPDNCYELTILRNFRDNYLLPLPEGPQLIAEYYEIAPRIVESIEQRVDAHDILDALYERVLASVHLIEAGELERATDSYVNLVNDLRSTYLDMASP